MSDFCEFRKNLNGKPTYVLLGVQGSGTNLTARILHRVFGVSIVRDRALILGVGASLVGRSTPDRLKQACVNVYRCHFPGPIRKRLLPRQWYHQASKYQGVEQYFDRWSLASPADFANFFYDYHAYRDACFEKGIKSDDCWQYLDRISEVIPYRKNILLVRDPRDNANSIMGKDFGPRTVYAASAYVKHQLDLYLRETDNHAEDSLTTTYETLLTNPLDFVHHFAKFSGLTVPDDVEQRLEKLNIRVTNFDKWKRWSEYDIAVSETLLRPYLERFGYEIHSPEPLKLTPAETARFRAIDIAKRIPQRLKSIWEHKILAK